ncbi:MAG: DUF192 domain-containing protein [Candidatus Omnitrophica bacterium]|jgi:hypothetical protein|nr:DUF192 domain-containing protein [Candidatus Omnitrophota bacterium]
MKIYNITKNVFLAQDALLADKFWQRMFGLLGKPALAQGSGIVLKPCNSIHTFFMRFSIDVIFIDRTNRVVKTVLELKPFRVTAVYLKACCAVELPAGSIKTSRTSSGDMLRLDK